MRPRDDTPLEPCAAPQPSAQQSVAAGADVVLLDCAGRVGGPTAAVAAGRAAAIEALRSSWVAVSDAVDPLVDAALAATLELFHRPAELRFSHPLYELIDAPVENRRVRAERLAALISAAPGFEAEATPLPAESPSSWGVSVRHAERAPASLAEELRAGAPSVRCQVVEQGVLLDLWTVFARQDRALADRFEPGGGQEKQATQVD